MKLNPLKIVQIIKFLFKIYQDGHSEGFWDVGHGNFDPKAHPLQNVNRLVSKMEDKNMDKTNGNYL